jgi:hypothetical protein
MSSALKNAHIALEDGTAHVSFQPGYVLKVSILCEGLDWQLSSLEQVCTSCLPFLSTENRVWLDLLHRFTAVTHGTKYGTVFRAQCFLRALSP